MIYLGNHGNGRDLDDGFYFWWSPSNEVSRKVIAQVRKSQYPKEGYLYAIRTQNWCALIGQRDCTREGVSEDSILVEEMDFDLDSFPSKEADLVALKLTGESPDWIDWAEVATSVGWPLTDVLQSPLPAFMAAVDYYGAHEFHPGGFESTFPPSGKVMIANEICKILRGRGVPKGDF